MGPDPAPLLAWDPAGSAAIRGILRAGAAVRRPWGALRDGLDAAAGALSARPLLLAAGALAAAPLLRILSPGPAGSAAAAFLAALAAVGGLLAAADRLHEGGERGWVRRALVAGLLLRLAFAGAIGAVGGFPDEGGYYDLLARAAAGDWTAGGSSMLGWHPESAGRWSYFYLLGGAYAAFGPALAVGRLLGVVLGLAAALLCGEAARGLGGRRAAALAVVLLALHPEHALWSATVSRDALSTVLVLAALAVAARRDGALLRGSLLAAVPLLVLLAANATLPAAALAAGLGAAVLVEGAAGLRSGTAGVLRAAAAAALAGALPAAAIRRWGPWLDYEHLSRLRSGVFHGDLRDLVGGGRLTADFLPGLRLTTLLETAAFLPLGTAFVLLAPWPWDATHALRAAYAPLAAVGAAVALAGAAGLALAVRRGRPGAVAAGVFALALTVELALLQGQSGILVRHRLPLTAVLVAGLAALAAGGREERAARQAGASSTAA
jgi:hypothetical protein